MGCRRVAPADQLVRVVHRADGSLSVDRTGPGRGAWLCAGSTACLDQALRRRAFDRALRAMVPPGAADGLRAEVEATQPTGTINFVPPPSGVRD